MNFFIDKSLKYVWVVRFLYFPNLQRAMARKEEMDEGKPKETNQMSTNEVRERVDHLESLVRTLYAMNANRILNDITSNKWSDMV